MEQTAISIAAHRQQMILEYLKSQFSITIKQAAELCNVSEATARRDIDEMAGAGMAKRTYGGVVLQSGSGFEQVHSEKMKVMIPEKIRIAREAAKLVKDGDCIFLDSGTTTLMLAQQLHNVKKLTVVTNNLDIAYSIRLGTSSTMIVTGGVIRDGYSVLIGDIAEELIRKLYVDIAFLGADAINVKNGIFNSNFMEICIKKSIISCGRKKVLLADNSKFRQKALAKVCDVDVFDTIITDTGLDAEDAEYLKSKVQNIILT